MAVAQDTFNLLRGVAYEGQIMDLNVAKIDSGPNAGTDAIPFGRFVVASGGGRSVALPGAGSTAADIVGISVRNPAWSNSSDELPYYSQYDIVSMLKNGRIAVIANGGCTRGGNVFVNIKGALPAGSVSGATSADNVELTGVKFKETVADGELVEIVIDGNLVV